MTALSEQNILERVANEKRSEAQSPLTRAERESLISKTANASSENPVIVAPFTGAVTAVTYSPNEQITGSAANGRTLSVINKGSANLGSATVASLTIGVGTVLSAFEQNAITLETANVAVTAGDVLVFKSAAGTGVADPGGEVRITFSKTVKTGSGAIANESTGFVGTVPAGA